MDDFKKYISQHKEELDIDVPSNALWQNIAANIANEKRGKVRSLFIKLSIAACFILLAGLGWFYIMPNNKSSESITNISKEENKISPRGNIRELNENIVATILPKIEKVNSRANPLPQQKNIPIITSTKSNSSTDNALLQNIETSFKQVIYLQKQRINTTPLMAESEDYFKDFSLQLKQMEVDEKRIKAVIKKQGFDNDLLDQLINIYQQKLNVLKQLQIEVNKTNNRYKQNREPIDTTKTYFLNI